jgi:phosphopantothenoylcysteine decarboxylase/phosphopantothenate--cysteine ligase
MHEHPSVDIIGTLGNELEGKTVVLGIAGSVAALRSADIARKLMRHGAQVIPVMTKAATELIHPNMLEWSTGIRPVTELTGKIEHVDYLGNVPQPADLYLVAPATANTLGKFACGIDDTTVTTFFTTAFGEGIPVIVVPAMHQAMYNHPFVLENIEKLRDHGVHVLDSLVEEGKAKIPGVEEIFQKVLTVFHPHKPLEGKKVTLTAGRTVEYMDPIRVISNNSTGKMGVAIAEAARDMGAEVTLVFGKGTVSPPKGVKVLDGETALKMKEAVQKSVQEGCDLFIAAAAVGDWMMEKPSEKKISTHDGQKLKDKLIIELVPTPKILDGVRALAPEAKIVAFRAQHDMTEEQLLADGKARLAKAQGDFIAINDVSKAGVGFESNTNALMVLEKNGEVHQIPLASKKKVATALLEIISKRL